ncbi:MAG: NUDIX hydrolase [Candidatus Binatia bacterium]
MTELVDIVDEEDRVMRQATRAEMRRDNLLHRAVYVVVLDSRGEIFVHRRTDTKDIHPGYWDVTVGGVVAAGEDYPSAARRELREELGITVHVLRPLAPVRYEDAHTRLRGAAFLTVHDGPIRLQEEEIASGGFVPLTEAQRIMAEQPCCPDGVRVLRAYLASAESPAAG